MKSTKFWIGLIAVVFIASAVCAVAVYNTIGTGTTVEIYHEKKLVDTIHLDTVTTPYSFTLETEAGGYNTISVEPGRICVMDASCPDHVCMDAGWIGDGALSIVCLPNKLSIQLIGNNEMGLDGAVQ